MSDERSETSHAGQDVKKPQSKAESKAEPKIFTEKVKTPHTTHWDLDYLPREAIEQAYSDRDDADDN